MTLALEEGAESRRRAHQESAALRCRCLVGPEGMQSFTKTTARYMSRVKPARQPASAAAGQCEFGQALCRVCCAMDDRTALPAIAICRPRRQCALARPAPPMHTHVRAQDGPVASTAALTHTESAQHPFGCVLRSRGFAIAKPHRSPHPVQVLPSSRHTYSLAHAMEVDGEEPAGHQTRWLAILAGPHPPLDQAPELGPLAELGDTAEVRGCAMQREGPRSGCRRAGLQALPPPGFAPASLPRATPPEHSLPPPLHHRCMCCAPQP